MNKKILFENSLEWIRCHPDALNTDVPKELLNEWVFDDNQDDPQNAAIFLSIFTFGLLQQELKSGNPPSGGKLHIPVSKVLECFTLWQIKLGLAAIHGKTKISVAPLSLFAFPLDEEIQCWPNDPIGNPSN